MTARLACRRGNVGHTDDCGQPATQGLGFAATAARLDLRAVARSAVCGNGVLARCLALHLLCYEAMQPDAWRLLCKPAHILRGEQLSVEPTCGVFAVALRYLCPRLDLIKLIFISPVCGLALRA